MPSKAGSLNISWSRSISSSLQLETPNRERPCLDSQRFTSKTETLFKLMTDLRNSVSKSEALLCRLEAMKTSRDSIVFCYYSRRITRYHHRGNPGLPSALFESYKFVTAGGYRTR